MGTNGWQSVMAILCVIAAVAVLGRQAWRLLRGGTSGACGDCSSCEPRADEPLPLVSLETDRPHRKDLSSRDRAK